MLQVIRKPPESFHSLSVVGVLVVDPQHSGKHVPKDRFTNCVRTPHRGQQGAGCSSQIVWGPVRYREACPFSFGSGGAVWLMKVDRRLNRLLLDCSDLAIEGSRREQRPVAVSILPAHHHFQGPAKQRHAQIGSVLVAGALRLPACTGAVSA